MQTENELLVSYSPEDLLLKAKQAFKTITLTADHEK